MEEDRGEDGERVDGVEEGGGEGCGGEDLGVAADGEVFEEDVGDREEAVDGGFVGG